MKTNILFFSTNHRDHIVLAHACKTWAVNQIANPAQMHERAQNVLPGTLAFFWITAESPHEPSTLVMPSIITTIPDIHKFKCDDPWPGKWTCPFNIRPLIHYNDRNMIIDELREIFPPNFSARLLLSGNFVFQPPELTDREITTILDHFFN